MSTATMRRACAVALGIALLLAIPRPRLVALQSDANSRFEIPNDDVLLDEVIPITVSGLPPQARVTVQLRGASGPQSQWASSATFQADESGRVDLTRTAPLKGSYKNVDAMGLFWSAEQATAARDGSDQE